MKRFDVRHLAFSGLGVCLTIGLGALTMAQNSGSGEVKSIQLSQREIIETLDGKDARAAWRLVTIAPGQQDQIISSGNCQVHLVAPVQLS